MPAVQETVARVREIDVDKYKYGFTTDIESVTAPKGLTEETVRFISAKKGEPDWLLDWRLEAYRRWLTMQEPTWANVRSPQDRLPGSLLLFGAEEHRGAEESRRGRSRAARDLCQARHSAEGAGGARRRRGRADRGPRVRGRCRVRLRLGGHHLQGGAGQGRRHLLLDLRGGADRIPSS